MNVLAILENEGELFNSETIEKLLNTITKNNSLDKEYLKDIRTFYYSCKDNNVRSFKFTESDDSVFKIVKLTNSRNFFTNPWSFGFIKQYGVWVGAYAGRHNELYSKLSKMCKKLHLGKVGKGELVMERLSFPKSISRSDVFILNKKSDEFLAKMLEILDSDEWSCKEELEFYISNLVYIARDKSLYRNQLPKGISLIENTNSITIVLNSRLLDANRNFIMIKVNLAKVSKSFVYEPFYSVRSIDVIDNPEEVELYKNLPVLDITNNHHLTFCDGEIEYIVDEKSLEVMKSKLDKVYEHNKYCKEELKTILDYSIEYAKVNKQIDKMFLAPYLNIKNDTISYLMPLIDNSTGSKSLNIIGAVVLYETGKGKWSPVTLLSLDTARSNARLLGKIHSVWLTN